MVDDGVTKAGVKCGASIEVLREEMPAVAKLLKRREIRPTKVDSNPTINGDGISAGELVNFDEVGDLSDEPMLFRGTINEDDDVGLALHQHDGSISPITGFVGSDRPLNGQKVTVRATIEPDDSVSWTSYALHILEWWDDSNADMEWDLEPGSNTADMQRLPSEDLFAKRGSYLRSSPVELRSGKFIIFHSRITFEGRDGKRYLISGDVDFESITIGEDYIVEAKAGIDNPDIGLPTLLIVQVHPEPGMA